MTNISDNGHPIDLDRRRRQLALLAIGLVMAMSPWFSTAAVAGQLSDVWDLSATQLAWLVITVQLGFVAGALFITVAGLADRFGPRRLIMVGASTAALANASLVVVSGHGPALVARFATGAALAAVYPPALKAMSSWYKTGRGLALGVMIGALTVGSALPHLINGLGGLRWQLTLAIGSAITLIGGLLIEFGGSDGPFATAPTRVSTSHLGGIVTNRRFLLASAGYFGHMWELYAMWAWSAAFFGDVFTTSRAASFAAFAVIGIGGAGSIYVGTLSDATTRPRAAARALRWSGLTATFAGFAVNAPPIMVVAIGLFWGFWVVADSAQFSAIVTEVVEPRLIGTALTVQLSLGFVLTVFTIFLVPVVRDWAGWGPAFLMLAPGPAVGAWAMSRLESGSRESDRHPHRADLGPGPVGEAV